MSRTGRRTAAPTRPHPSPAPPRARRGPPAALAAAVASLLVHLPSVGFGFVRDDHGLIEDNFFLRGGFPLRLMVHDFWASAEGASGLWRPLILLSYWVDARLGHGAPGLLHAMNVAADAVVAGLVAALVRQWGGSWIGALLAGLAFAWMPAHVESVAWISGRTDVYCAMFLLAALLLDGRSRRLGRPWPGVLALVAWALALLSKETAAGLLVAIAIADWIGRPRARLGARVAWLAPYAAIAIAWFVVHERFADRPALPPSLHGSALVLRRWAGWTLLPTHLGFLWPGFPHSPDYMVPLPAGPADPRVVGGIVLFAVAIGLTAWLVATRRHAALALAFLWLPVLPATAAAITRGYGFYGERHAYLPSIGAAWLFGIAWDRASGAAPAGRALTPRRIVAALAAGMLLAWSLWGALRLQSAWRSDDAMFEAMTRLQPAYAVGHAGWGNALLARGDDRHGARELAIADSLDPTLPEVPLSLATWHARRGAWEQALSEAGRAVRLDPRRLQARRLQATALIRLGRTAEGRVMLERILEEVPEEPRTEALLGEALVTESRFADARPRLERAALQVNDDPSLWFALGTARLQTGDPAAARAALEQTVRLEPTFYDGWLRLALVASLQGDAAGRDGALARAAALPEARDGRVAQLQRLLSGSGR